MLECVFNKVEGLMHTPLLKRDSSTGVFSVNFARFFRTHILYNMWTTASRISENRPCLASWEFIFVLHHYFASVFKLLRCSFQLILHWWAPIQRTKVDNAMQMITEGGISWYLDTCKGKHWNLVSLTNLL